MKSFGFSSDIKRIREILSLSQQELAFLTKLSFPTINAMENGERDASWETMERIYGFAYTKLRLNKAKEMIFIDHGTLDRPPLFHGASGDIVGEVDCAHSLPPNDFGDGFYLGQSLEQAATWVADREKGSVYCFYFDTKDLRFERFDVDRDWMYAILYFRGAFGERRITTDVNAVIDRVKSCDYLIAPIADNSMYDTLESFARGEITDEACLHALSANNLGYQCVLKTQKACDRLCFIDRLFLCQKEKEDYLGLKKRQSDEGRDKMRLSLVEYRR